MVYEVFLATITQELQARLGDDYKLTIQPLQKNNGIMLDGLSILAPGATAAPTVYMNPYYAQYQHGMSVEEIINDIIHLVQTTPVPTYPTTEEMNHFELLKSKVMFKIIHASSNESLLSDVPHIAYLDLAIVFYLYLERNSYGQMTALIHNSHQKRWNVSELDLWQLALENTQREFPAEIRNLSDLMKEIIHEKMGSDCSSDLIDELLLDCEVVNPLYVMTNPYGVNGAACLLYPNVLKNFADFLDQDFVILPSSIHEVIITPDTTETSYEELSALVSSINYQEVPLEDQLSNQVYLYTRKDHQLHMVPISLQSPEAFS